MTAHVWTNYFVFSKDAFATDGHLSADRLRAKIKAHKGGEAYHCAYDLDGNALRLHGGVNPETGKTFTVERTDENLKRFPPTFKDYAGVMRPALGYVWFDFDSKDGGEAARKDTLAFLAWLAIDDATLYYSGSKGFHVGVPFGYFGLEPAPDLSGKLHAFATKLTKRFPSMDTTIYNANRKFRALGSKHDKTGLFKVRLTSAVLSEGMEGIKRLAKKRGSLEIPEPSAAHPLACITELLNEKVTYSTDSISLADWRKYRQPEGTEAFKQCGFLTWAKDHPAKVNEPQWYAAASIVGRFKDGRAQFHALSKGHPGYSATQTDEKLEQALQASGPRTCEAIDTLWTGCKTCPHYQKIKSPVVILEKDVIATEATGFYDLIREGDKVKRVPNYNDLLQAFQRDRPYKTIADMKTVYAFTGTHYAEFTPIEIKAFAEDQFSPKPPEKLRQEFMHKVFANRVDRKAFFQQGTENAINFKNGILNLESKSLVPHSPDFGFRWVLPYDFNPQATCETFDWWIKDVMLGDAALVQILQEFMGYVIRGGEYKYHKALWLSGSGRNGKSTFLSVLKALIGAGNYSTLSIKQIIGDKFSSADLDGKIANFSEETSPEELSDSGPFKNLTGDGELLAQKKYGDPYSFRNRAKLIMTYNEVPLLKDLSPGMLSRPIIVPWKKDLSEEGAQDRNLKAKLLAELPGIFNFALSGWERLERQEDFTASEKSALEMEEIRRSSCTAAQWVADTIVFEQIETADCLKPRQLYEAYKQTIGQYAYGENKFYKRLNSIPEVAKRRRRTTQGIEYFSMKFRRKHADIVEF